MQLWGPYLERNFLEPNLEPSPSQHLPWNFVGSSEMFGTSLELCSEPLEPPLEPEAWNPKTPDLVGRLGIGRVCNGEFDYVVFQQGFENA